jgi:hypothetical protein
MFQSCFRLHRHVRNYANEKVVLANHRTRSRGLSANCVTAGFAWLLTCLSAILTSTPRLAAKLRDSGTDLLSNLWQDAPIL